jgi:hypothetical protein
VAFLDADMVFMLRQGFGIPEGWDGRILKDWRMDEAGFISFSERYYETNSIVSCLVPPFRG